MNRGREQEDVGRYYRLLGVKEGAPMESVRRGYHRMSKDHQYVFLNTLCSLGAVCCWVCFAFCLVFDDWAVFAKGGRQRDIAPS